MKKLVATFSIFALAAPAALAAGSSIKVSPGSVKGGKKVNVSGTVSGCSGPVTVYSRAINSTHKFAGIPSVSATVKSGKFSVSVKTTKKKGTYKISGRCGGGNIGRATLKVTGGGGSGPGGGFY